MTPSEFDTLYKQRKEIEGKLRHIDALINDPDVLCVMRDGHIGFPYKFERRTAGWSALKALLNQERELLKLGLEFIDRDLGIDEEDPE